MATSLVPTTKNLVTGTDSIRDNVADLQNKVSTAAKPITLPTGQIISTLDPNYAEYSKTYPQASSPVTATSSVEPVKSSPIVTDTTAPTSTKPATTESASTLNLGTAPVASDYSTSQAEIDRKVKQARESAAAAYQPLISEAETAKRLGMPKAEIAAGERGGFMSTQFAGQAALRKTGGGTFIGAGGILEEQLSAYDNVISNYKQQQIVAANNAEAAMKDYIATGDSKAYQNAIDAYKANKDAKVAEWNAVKDKLDLGIKADNYNLEVQKYLSSEKRAENKEAIDKAKLDLDIASAKGFFADGTKTQAAKEAMARELYQKLGYDLDINKFKELQSQNKISNDIEQKKLDLEQSKFEAANSGIDINQSVQDAINGMTGIEKGQPGYQAFKAALNAQKTVYKEEAKNTGNPYYDLKATAGNSGKLSDTQQTNLGKVFTVADQLDDLKTVFDSMKQKGKTGAIVGKMKKLDFTDPEVAAFKAQLAGIVPNVARGIFGEVGVLTDNDMNNYAKAIANIDNPDAAFDVIFSNLLKNLKSKATSDLKMAANNQKNVSGFADDYQSFINRINEKIGEKPLQQSTNPVVYDGVSSFRAGVGEDMYGKWAETASKEMSAAGITDVDDYFQALKEASMDKGILKDVDTTKPTSGGGGTSEIKPSFNNVGADTNKGVEIGKLSEKYESGGNPGAIGYDSTGGYSYGKYQLAHNNAQSFVDQSKYAKDFKGIAFNSPEWQSKWKEIAKKDPTGFGDAQQAFIERTHYVPQLTKIVNSGIDISKFSPILADVVWSTAVQHGANTDIVVKAYNDAKNILGREPNDQEFITQIYNERWSNGERFVSSTPAVKEGVKKRFIAERNEALKKLI